MTELAPGLAPWLCALVAILVLLFLLIFIFIGLGLLFYKNSGKEYCEAAWKNI